MSDAANLAYAEPAVLAHAERLLSSHVGNASARILLAAISINKKEDINLDLAFIANPTEIDEDYKIIPKQGAYIISSLINDAVVYGMMNIGMNPTVNGTKQTIEVHFFDFKKDIYGETIQIDLLHRIRNEEKFESVDALKLQLAKDKETALDFIAKSHAE